jgi:ribose 1,5-bisphosphokinase
VSKGQLFFLIGASGSTNENVLRAIRRVSKGGDSLAIAHRYITRPPNDRHENHISLTREEFVMRRKAGCFALHWECKGLHFAIGKEVDTWRDCGVNVIIKGSHRSLEKALEVYPDLVTINVAESSQRLGAKRSTSSTVSTTLADKAPENMHMLDNSRSIDRTATQFFSYLRG